MSDETKDVMSGLAYIADSPAREYGGFHPSAVQTAKDAMAEIARLRARIEVYAKAVDQRDDIIQALSAGLAEAITSLDYWGIDYFPHDTNMPRLAADIARLTAILETGKAGEGSEPRHPLRFDCPPLDVLRQMHPLPALSEVMERNERAIAKAAEVTTLTDPHPWTTILCTACGRPHLATEKCDPWAVAYRAAIKAADVAELTHVATDEDGEACAFGGEPERLNILWMWRTPLGMALLATIDPLPGDWRGSLRKVEDVWPELKRNQGKDGGE